MKDVLLILPSIAGNEALLERACWSLLETGTHWVADFCFVLDGDVDMRVFDRLPHAHWLRRYPEREGLVKAYNRGLSIFHEPSTGMSYQFVIFMEDGIVVTEGWHQRLRRMLEHHPSFGWVACGQQENPRAPFTTLCSMMSRGCLELVKQFDDAYSPCQFDDQDMFKRVEQAGFTPRASGHLISHPASRTSRVGTEEEDIALMLRHRETFLQRWGTETRMDCVPVHTCALCA